MSICLGHLNLFWTLKFSDSSVLNTTKAYWQMPSILATPESASSISRKFERKLLRTIPEDRCTQVISGGQTAKWLLFVLFEESLKKYFSGARFWRRGRRIADGWSRWSPFSSPSFSSSSPWLTSSFLAMDSAHNATWQKAAELFLPSSKNTWPGDFEIYGMDGTGEDDDQAPLVPADTPRWGRLMVIIKAVTIYILHISAYGR